MLRALPPDAPPLIRYRVAACFAASAAVLEGVRAEVPGFIETALFLGRLELRTVPRTGGPRARTLLREVYARFPGSPAATSLNGNLDQLAGDCTAALRYYDETLALEPTHEEALLGRTVCLSRLARHDEAIAVAGRILDLGGLQSRRSALLALVEPSPAPAAR